LPNAGVSKVRICSDKCQKHCKVSHTKSYTRNNERTSLSTKGVNLKNGSQEKSIGIIIKDLNYPFYTSIATGVKKYANSKGYSVLVTSSENDHEYEKKFSHFFSAKDIRGAIIAPIIEGTSEIEHLFKKDD
jgi:DNA-binding LacI/PurR family transcriptional regulator